MCICHSDEFWIRLNDEFKRESNLRVSVVRNGNPQPCAHGSRGVGWLAAHAGRLVDDLSHIGISFDRSSSLLPANTVDFLWWKLAAPSRESAYPFDCIPPNVQSPTSPCESYHPQRITRALTQESDLRVSSEIGQSARSRKHHPTQERNR